MLTNSRIKQKFNDIGYSDNQDLQVLDNSILWQLRYGAAELNDDGKTLIFMVVCLF